MLLSDTQKNLLTWTIKKPHVNSTCIGCSTCTTISGDVFFLDDDGLSRVNTLDDYAGYDVDDSIAACPVGAISWQDANRETGEYLGGIVEHGDVSI